MATKPTQEKIDQFKRDVAILESLGHTLTEIAAKMGMKPMQISNFSKYLNNYKSHPITERFLTKFYKAWGKQLKLAEDKVQSAPHEPLPDTMAHDEGAQSYLESLQDHIDTLKKTNDSLQKKNNSIQKNLDQVIAINQKLTHALINLGANPGKAERTGEIGKNSDRERDRPLEAGT